MLNGSASLAMSPSGLKALPGKFDIKRHSPSIYLYVSDLRSQLVELSSYLIYILLFGLASLVEYLATLFFFYTSSLVLAFTLKLFLALQLRCNRPIKIGKTKMNQMVA